MLERTQVFVDTSYLLASFYNSWETGARAQLEIDLPEVVAQLGNMINNQLNQPIHRQFWYDGIPDSGPHRYQRALRTCDGVLLRAGQLIEWGERRTQKAVDTRLVADMVLAAVRQHCSDIVLVSGDADMIPGVQEATSAGVRVHLYGFGWDSMSSALRHACDTTTILDPREDFADTMQLQVLEGPLPLSVRTKPIGDAEPVDDMSPTTVPKSAMPPEPPTNSRSAGEDSSTGAASAAEPTADDAPSVPAPAEQAPKGPTPNDLAGTGPVTPKPGERKPADSSPTQTPEETAAAEESASAAPATPTARSETAPDDVGGSMAEPASPATPPASAVESETRKVPKPSGPPKPSMMAPRRKLRSRYVPLPNEVWTSAGSQTPYDVGQQYASWWYDNAASVDQRDQAHLLSGGGLPPEIDRPLLQFACETLHEYTLSEAQRVNLRDGFHAGIRGVLLNIPRER
ncbi:NYN domain-containing protein [Corynebacterium halotolerans]|uniref:NYN domain-containing protein n=1 Tax=Corynebacterium halotolerans TaxID=225326 RepID=UPI003CF12778